MMSSRRSWAASPAAVCACAGTPSASDDTAASTAATLWNFPMIVPLLGVPPPAPLQADTPVRLGVRMRAAVYSVLKTEGEAKFTSHARLHRPACALSRCPRQPYERISAM